jgi:uncharacterized membrane protein (UPF0127 family)
MMGRGLIGVVIGIFTVIGGTAVFLAATGGTAFEAKAPVEQTTIVTINGRPVPVELAATTAEHAQGLSDRDNLAPGSGMLFVFAETKPTSFWMRNMRFNLDIVWIRDGKIVGIERNAPKPAPGTAPEDLPLYESGEAVSHVLEVNAGEAAEWAVGDAVEIKTIQTI